MNELTILNKNFILTAAGRIVSAFGSQILRYALPLYLLLRTGSSALFGSISAVSFIPMIVLLPAGGIIADRLNKRNIMLVMDLCTGILISVFCMLSEKIDIVPLTAVTMIILYAIDGADRPAVKASVPALAGPGNMMRANSVIDVIDSSASMAGPVTGGLLFSSFGLMPILYISTGCFFASVIMDMFIYIPHEKREMSKNIFAAGKDDLSESFQFMFRGQPVLWKISAVFALSNLLLTSLVLIGLPVIITQRLGFAPDTANRLYGYAQGAAAAGAVAGGLLAGALSGRLNPKAGPVLLGGCSLCVIAAGAALQMLNSSAAVYAVLITACGLMLTLHTVFQIQMMTLLQLLTPKNLTGKVISCFMCAVMCTMPLGQAVYGFAFEHAGQNVFLLFYAAGTAMTAVCCFARHVFSAAETETESSRENAVN